MKPPTAKARQKTVYTYALWLYGDPIKAQSYVRAWTDADKRFKSHR